jgi:excisionase family DNA binding protein
MRETLTLEEAARFLKLSPEALRRKTKAGMIPGAKVGKCWCFYKLDLVDYLRSRYARPRQASQSGKEVASCHSKVSSKSGAIQLIHPTAEFSSDLRLPSPRCFYQGI